MLWWIVVALLVALPLLARAVDKRRALPAKAAVPALPPSVHALRERLAGVDAAIEEVRAVIDLVTPRAAQACAELARSQVSGGAGAREDSPIVVWRPGEPSDDSTGPGTARFAALLVALADIGDEDLRDLEDAGLDRESLVDAISAPDAPERWVRELLQRLDYWQQVVGTLRARRYG